MDRTARPKITRYEPFGSSSIAVLYHLIVAEAYMGRPKQFNREGVLDRAIPVFWKHGFANTTLQHLEEATGVNKSGLYSEFKDKEDLFLASLQRYAQTRGAEILTAQPLGWGNIERFLRLGFGCDDDQRGCFAVNSMRELAGLPAEAQEIILSSQQKLTRLLMKNIEAEDPKLDASMIADVVLTFFHGFCIAQNLKGGKASSERKIRNLMQVLRNL
jgi:AcrR family transcriptional regulator